jgi:hypothetical protein
MDSPEDVLTAVRDAVAAGDLATAEVVLRQASKRWSREPEFAIRHAKVLTQMNNEKSAYKVYRKVMKKAPERLDACRGAADAAIQIGKGRDAEKLYGRAIGLGMSLDEATAGIARSFSIRKRYAEAWEKAVTQFKDSGRKSRDLHSLLTEISPIVGAGVPPLNEFDMADVEQVQVEVRRDQDDPMLTGKSFEAGSLEAMAGVDKGTLVDDDILGFEGLLEENKSTGGETSLGIDLSFLDTSPQSAPPAPTGDAASTQTGAEIQMGAESQTGAEIQTGAESQTSGFSTDDLDLTESPPTTESPLSADKIEVSPQSKAQPVDDEDPFADWPDV